MLHSSPRVTSITSSTAPPTPTWVRVYGPPGMRLPSFIRPIILGNRRDRV